MTELRERQRQRGAGYPRPPLPAPDFCLYHWSPRARRKQIIRRGLVPGSTSIDREWKPPYVCFSDEPRLAWILSGGFHPEVETWDLWMVYASSSAIRGYEAIIDSGHGTSYIKEYRVYHRIFKRDLFWIAERSNPVLPSERVG